MKPLKHINERKGVATVLVVGVLVFFLIAFIVLAIDLSFIYVVRGELQNAADAAALAGASVIEDVNDPEQLPAKEEAKKFALRNYAAGEDVVVDDADITVGFWDGSQLQVGVTPVNAMKVVARRTGDNPVPLFFGRIIGKTTMEVSRVAIASNPARAEAPIALCFTACGADKMGGGIINAATGTSFFSGSTDEEKTFPTFAVAYTDFSTHSGVDVPSVVKFFCGKLFNACKVEIDTNTGVMTMANRQFRCAFLNPKYDSDHKVCADSSGTEVSCLSFTPGSGIVVKSWSPLIPLVREDECPTGAQEMGNRHIKGYARAKIIDVLIESDGGIGSGSPTNCACQALADANYDYIKSPDPVDGKLAVIINSIDCVECDSDDIKKFLGRSPYLVK